MAMSIRIMINETAISIGINKLHPLSDKPEGYDE